MTLPHLPEEDRDRDERRITPVEQRLCEHAMLDARGYCVVCKLWRPYVERGIANRIARRLR